MGFNVVDDGIGRFMFIAAVITDERISIIVGVAKYFGALYCFSLHFVVYALCTIFTFNNIL